MNVVSSASAKTLGHPSDSPKTSGSTPLNLYNDDPSFELTLDEFEVYALKRLKVGQQIP